MALHQGTMKLTPQQANYIPAGKFIYTDETFSVSKPITSDESFPRQGKALILLIFHSNMEVKNSNLYFNHLLLYL